MDQEQINAFGDALYEAWRSGVPVAPLTRQAPGITIDDAYRIQVRMVRRRIQAGERIIGKKIGVTSKPVMDMLGVDQPDFGHLTDGMLVAQGQAIRVSGLISPRVESEVAFVLRRTLQGPGVTPQQVLAATDHVVPCFEIVDSRIQDWKIRIQDTVADNASCGLIVLGSTRGDPRQLDLAAARMELHRNGTLVSTSSGASVQGSPLNAVAWLANTLGGFGLALEAGEVILSGSQSPLVPVEAGDEFRCEVQGLGTTVVRFS